MLNGQVTGPRVTALASENVYVVTWHNERRPSPNILARSREVVRNVGMFVPRFRIRDRCISSLRMWTPLLLWRWLVRFLMTCDCTWTTLLCFRYVLPPLFFLFISFSSFFCLFIFEDRMFSLVHAHYFTLLVRFIGCFRILLLFYLHYVSS